MSEPEREPGGPEPQPGGLEPQPGGLEPQPGGLEPQPGGLGPQPDRPMWNDAEGAAEERTRLAWRRTVLAGTVVAMLTVRLAVTDGVDVWHGLVIATVALGWVVLLALAQRRIAAMASRAPARVGRTLPIVALMTVGAAVLGALLAVTPG